MAVSANVRGNNFDGGQYRSIAQRWEYQEIHLPLNLGTMRGWFGAERLFRRVERRADEVIERHIEALSAQGWKPDEPANFASLYKRDRVDASYRGGVIPGHSFHHVRIRFKRATS